MSTVFRLAPFLLVLLATPAHAILVDDFEAGPFSIGPGGFASQVSRPGLDAQVLGSLRTVTLSLGVSASLGSTANADRVVMNFPASGGRIDFDYALASPLDLRRGQRAWLYADLDTVPTNKTLQLRLEDENGVAQTSFAPIAPFAAPDETFLDLSQFTTVDLKRIVAIRVSIISPGSASFGFQEMQFQTEGGGLGFEPTVTTISGPPYPTTDAQTKTFIPPDPIPPPETKYKQPSACTSAVRCSIVDHKVSAARATDSATETTDVGLDVELFQQGERDELTDFAMSSQIRGVADEVELGPTGAGGSHFDPPGGVRVRHVEVDGVRRGLVEVDEPQSRAQDPRVGRQRARHLVAEPLVVVVHAERRYAGELAVRRGSGVMSTCSSSAERRRPGAISSQSRTPLQSPASPDDVSRRCACAPAWSFTSAASTRHLRTGNYCGYFPQADERVTWDVKPGGGGPT